MVVVVGGGGGGRRSMEWGAQYRGYFLVGWVSYEGCFLAGVSQRTGSIPWRVFVVVVVLFLLWGCGVYR